MPFGLDGARSEWRIAAKSRFEQPARGGLRGHRVTTAGEGTADRARRLTPAGTPAVRIDADRPATTATVTRPLRSPVRTGPQPRADRRSAGWDATVVDPHHPALGSWG